MVVFSILKCQENEHFVKMKPNLHLVTICEKHDNHLNKTLYKECAVQLCKYERLDISI